MPSLRVTTLSERPRKVTIGKLSDEVLLNIFRHYLVAFPRCLPGLVHICRKWRHIVFSSQQILHLRLFCTHGTPVLDTLNCWPALPIVVEYGGSPALDSPSPEDEDNILAALKRSDRVSSIGLTVTRSLLAKIFTIEGPFSELEELFLLSRDNIQVTLPSAFRWGPRLRRLHSTGIGFPSPLQRLSSSRDLVDILLHGISNSGFLSSDALAHTLSEMAQLQSLSLHFLSTTNRITMPLWSGERVILPSLTRLDFRGSTEYLEDLLARIDAPRLMDIEITFLDEPIFSVSNSREFRMEMQKSHRQADILFSEHSVSISLSQSAPTCLKLQVFCEPLSQQLFSVAQVCSRFSSFLFCVEDLRIKSTRLSSWQVGAEQWLELIHSFESTKWFHVAGDLSTKIVLALQPPQRREAALPALHKLYVPQPAPSHAPLREAVVSFMHSHWLSGHFIVVEYERLDPFLST
ncbi:hypothetical protein EDB84DRAFT_1163928 [Lactarius hengduanensis]|nr:hypothetical protein EDB84DRAFT_1163928 [Lactarius hengduanensis]